MAELITRGERNVQVVPALHRPRTGALDRHCPELRFSRRVTRAQRYPVEQRLATLPGPSRLGRNLDIRV